MSEILYGVFMCAICVESRNSIPKTSYLKRFLWNTNKCQQETQNRLAVQSLVLTSCDKHTIKYRNALRNVVIDEAVRR